MNRKTNVHCNLPMTNSFIYNDKKFPFNIFLFNCFSRFFLSQPQIYQQGLDINLNDEFGYDAVFTEDSIQDFINYCQKIDITLGKENVLQVHKLAKKFIVSDLIKATEDYISNNRNDFVIQFLTMNPEEQKSDTDQYEDIISNFLTEYIQDERLISFPVPFLFRVITKYQLKNQNRTNSEVVEFLFKCLDKHGRSASVLFQNIDFCNEHQKYLQQLFSEKYSTIFDFHFINTNYHKAIYELHNEIIQKEEFIKQNNTNISKLYNDQNEQINHLTNEVNELKRLQSEALNSLKEEKDKQIKEQAELFTQQLRSLKEEKDRQISELTQQLNDLKNSFKQNQSICEKEIEYNGNNQLQGILRYLADKYEGNIHLNKIIKITCSNCSCGSIEQLVDFNRNYHTHICNFNPQGWIQFDFKTRKLQINSYLLQTNCCSGDLLKSWRIEISNDGAIWEKIDEHNDMNELGENNIIKEFKVQMTNKFRFIRIITDKNGFLNRNYISIGKIEFYGKLFKYD